ncbi:MAG: uroporphyrinogen-III C-methyltransferase [Candidatus Glassbacteria bacterium GWA2_58_10]|uniref:uroporphyrinogen-III C-methyltransferase n=1 Tax=Candidatus Glassbacteria bacterium GWA2_58_10 TaxID=1817865 RepID=A0A1F5YJF5_9BACT|nr:MAG: uroporphyrinogen-III C-methyltransferase [Candidatus Glassbacteria bacterium GWA2_58_10]
MPENNGKIILVGAGPGDPDLLTIKGRKALEQAEVLIYDYLAPKELLCHAPESCEKIYVGKQAGCHTLRQEEINRLLVEKARLGLTVVRLKGGDPYVFGRGGEEALAAGEAEIPFEVVPGVTAGVAVPAYAGIPVTQRGYASTLTLITGHEDPNKEESDIDWASLAAIGGTLVFYMGIGRLGKIAGSLIEHGRSADTPAAVIRRGTTFSQRTVTGTLGDIEERVREAELKPPALIVVGQVVGLRGSLDWFEKRPLFGRTVIVTRAREQASDFSELLKGMGAGVVELPTIKIGPSPEPERVNEVLCSLSGFDWIVFTSANGVKVLLEELRRADGDVRWLGRAHLCAIGPATAAALEASGLRVDLMPESYVAESVVEALQRSGELQGKRVLLPRAEIARKILPEALTALGAIVEEVALYSTRLEEPENLAEVRRALADGEIDVVSFTSSSTVENFVTLVGEKTLRESAKRTLFASIGPVTVKKAEEYGLKSAIVPKSFTIHDLALAIRDFFALPEKSP